MSNVYWLVRHGPNLFRHDQSSWLEAFDAFDFRALTPRDTSTTQPATGAESLSRLVGERRDADYALSVSS
jgi:hypothetical protein